MSMRRHLLARLRWLHRWCGLVAGVGVLWLSLTGLPLFMADNWGLSRAALPAWIERVVYGERVDHLPLYRAGAHSLTGSREHWQFDGHGIDDPPGVPLALGGAPGHWFAVGARGLLLLGEQGEVIERIESRTLGVGSISASATAGQQFCVRGSDAAACSIDGVDWLRSVPAAIVWQPIAPPAAGSGATLTWERLFQDLHALRFLGPPARWLGVLLALSLMFLAVTGAWQALSRHRHHLIHHQPGAGHPRQPERPARPDRPARGDRPPHGLL